MSGVGRRSRAAPRQSAGATARGGLLVIHGDASARCGISLKGADIVVRGSVGHMSAFMAQAGRLRGLRRRRRGARRLALRGAAVRARLGRRPRRRLHREGDARRARRAGPPAARSAPGSTTSTPPSSAATARPGRLYNFNVDNVGALLMPCGPERLAPRAARVGDVRPQRDRRDPAGGARGDLRHPRIRRQAPGAALRRSAVPRRQRVALSAGGLPRAVRDRRHDRDPVRARADPARHPDHDRRDELRRAVGAGQGGARPRSDRGRDLHDDRRRRHDARGARALARCSSTSCCPRATG